MKRDCPRCFSALRPEIIRKGIWKVEIDRCGSCSGLFLDKGELMTLTGNRPLHYLTTKHLGIDSDSETRTAQGTAAKSLSAAALLRSTKPPPGSKTNNGGVSLL